MFNVQIISKEMIKPSSPTPDHLVNHELSSLDQIAPPFYVPMIFFYDVKQLKDANFSRKSVSQHLKKSLSDVLVQFYVLAGRMNGTHSITCNDDGVEFIETEVKDTNLSHIIGEPKMEELNKFLPMDSCGGTSPELLVSVQINHFNCGGIAIGICISHKIADGHSLVTFATSWATKSIGGSNNLLPDFNLAKKFPARKASSNVEIPRTGTKEEIVTKRFVFDKKILGELRKLAAFGSQVKDPSRVEAISIFIWRLFLKEASAKNKKINRGIVHAVNLRPRIGDVNFYGNLWSASMEIIGSEQYFDNQDLLSLLRKSIRKLDKEFVKNLGNGDYYADFVQSCCKMLSNGQTELYNFSSWCRFPVYETDFGWGKPVWVCTTTMPLKNLVVLMGMRNGEGLETWINLSAEDMAVLEEGYELLSRSSEN